MWLGAILSFSQSSARFIVRYAMSVVGPLQPAIIGGIAYAWNCVEALKNERVRVLSRSLPRVHSAMVRSG